MAKILIVDDDPDIREGCTLVLESEGHTVTCAANRAEGMRAIQAEVPDLLILDVMMEQPDDGMAMAQTLRDQGFPAPILMLTSISRATGMTYEADDELMPVDLFVEKPVAPQRLIELVTQLLDKKA
ncbi:MAG: response regulator transcription factor [Candidatus Hydrogenedentota bacterium]